MRIILVLMLALSSIGVNGETSQYTYKPTEKSERITIGYKLDEFSPSKKKPKVKKEDEALKKANEAKKETVKERVKQFFLDIVFVFTLFLFVVLCLIFLMFTLGALFLCIVAFQHSVMKKRLINKN